MRLYLKFPCRRTENKHGCASSRKEDKNEKENNYRNVGLDGNFMYNPQI